MKRIYYYIRFAILISGVVFLHSCSDINKNKIYRLEKEFKAASDPAKKSELANLLHKQYSLYHLKNTKDTSFLLNWAEMAMQGREYQQVKWIYDQYLEIDERNTNVYIKRGRINAGLGYFSSAGEDFQEAAKMTGNIDEKSGLLKLSYKYLSADSIINQSEQQIIKGENIVKNTLVRAEKLIEMNQLTAARIDIEHALMRDKKNPYAYFLFSKFWTESDNLQAAEEMIEKYFTLAESTDTSFQKAEELESVIADKIKLASLSGEIKENPGSYSKLVDAGIVSFRLKEYEQAEIYFEELIEFYPDSLLGHLYRGQVNIQKGRLNQAMNDIEKVLKLNPENISAHNLKAYIHLLRKEYEMVRKEIDQIRSLNGEPLEILQRFTENK